MALLLTGLGSIYFRDLFKIPADFLATARILFLLIGTDVALAFPFSVFGCTLEGYQKFLSLNLTHIAAALLRGVLILWVLSKGAGLIVVALIAVGVNLVRQLGCAYLVIWGTPLRLSVRYLDRSMLDKLINYSTVAIAIFIGENLRFQSDAIVIGAFLSSAAITYFAIGSKLVEYPASLVIGMAQIFTPIASHYDARGDREALQKVFVASNRACAFVIFPICAALIIMGRSIIQLWVGPRYLPSYFIRVVLILPKSLLLAQAGSIRILLGIGRQHLLALVSLLEGVANLALSILLLPRWGILGVAVGTAVPLACTSLFFLPRHLCGILDMPLVAFLRRAYLAPLVLISPMVGALLVLRRLLPSPGFGELLLQVVVGSLAYGSGLLCWAWTSLAGSGVARLSFSQLWNQPWNYER